MQGTGTRDNVEVFARAKRCDWDGKEHAQLKKEALNIGGTFGDAPLAKPPNVTSVSPCSDDI